MFTRRRRGKILTCAELQVEFNSDMKKVSKKEMTNTSFRTKWISKLRERPDCVSLKRQLNSLKSAGI